MIKKRVVNKIWEDPKLDLEEKSLKKYYKHVKEGKEKIYSEN
jgi:hypothetical protein